jgi:hypothetical protein
MVVLLVQRVVCELENRRDVVQFRAGKTFRRDLRHHPASYSMTITPGSKWPECENNHPPRTGPRLRVTVTIVQFLRMLSRRYHGQLYLFEDVHNTCVLVGLLAHEVQFENF